jgi:lipoic acid synthetase
MILGGRCTRSCRFCAVDSGRPSLVDSQEPWRVAEAVRRLGLRHVVITSVARDDLRDEGADHFVRVIHAVRRDNPGVTVEVLVPDFHAREDLLAQVLDEGRPEVFAHNIETVERLSPLLRPQAAYRRSLAVLRTAGARGGRALPAGKQIIVKSGLMVGLGETLEEVRQTFDDLVEAGVTHVTIGQYLRPEADHLPVMEYVSPSRFRLHEQLAHDAGWRGRSSAAPTMPLTRLPHEPVHCADPAASQAAPAARAAAQ